MPKRLPTHVTTLAFSALTLLMLFFIPALSQAAQATLTWDPNDPPPDGYCIYQRTEGQAYDYSQPCWTGYGNTGTVVGLEENTSYYFVVRAFVATQDSANSNEVKFINGALSPIMIEAEDANLQWPMVIGDDAAASAGGYVWVPSGTGDLFNPSSNNGYAEYHFEVPENGDYVIWGRQISNDSASDSFFVSVDGQADMVWNTLSGGQNVWTWDAVSNPNESSPQQYWLAAGFHTLTIKQREDGTKLDSIVITNDLNLGASDFDAAVDVTLTADVNGDGYVNFTDLAQLRADFGRTGTPGWIPTDMNSDGSVNFTDLAILRSQFGL